MEELDKAILGAIKLIIEKSGGYQISYDVKHTLEKDFFRKEGIRRICIDVTLSKSV